VCLDIYAGGRLIGQALANRYREDLEQAGLGSGCHSFAFKLPAGFALAAVAVEVRRSLDGTALEFSGEARRRIAASDTKAKKARLQRAAVTPRSKINRRVAVW
jgi:hypothetical protein